MKFSKSKVASACMPLLLLSVMDVNAQPVPGGTLDPLTIPKYVTPLVIPPALYDDNGSPMNVEMALRRINQQILPEGFPTTNLWGYGDPDRPNTFFNPAFTFEVTQNTLSTVTWINQLVVDPEECFDDGDGDHGDSGNHGDSGDHGDSGHHGDHGHHGDRGAHGDSRGDNDDRVSKRRDDDDPRGNDGHHGDDDDGHHGEGRGRRPECHFLPHIITDAAGNPIIDQTLHWAAPNQECADGIPRTDCAGASDQPYTGPIPMVTHVHGAHVGPISDGYPEAWWLPDANDIPSGYATEGTFYDDISGGAPGTGSATYQYTNDQPTSTLWYHDHSLGMTRLNVYAAGAGFWLIRDDKDGETGLAEGQSFPGPAPVLGSNPNTPGADRDSVREIPIAIQPKSFNSDGSQYYPADRQFFEGLGDGQSFALNDNMSSLVTADGSFPFLPPQNGSDIAPVWNPEAFFNTMVVNGRTWPQLDVAAERYRFRLLNASDSRFLNLALFVVDPATNTIDPTQEIPFYQIGSEQGLLPDVVRIETGFATPLPGNGSDVGSGVTALPGTFDDQALLIGPAERHDVIVDFTGLPDGATVRMINTAPDAPFGGFPDVPADPDTTGQVMQFMVNVAMNNSSGDSSTPPADLVLDDNPGGVAKLGPSTVIQDLALLEEESALLCVEVDGATGAITHVAGDPIAGCPLGSDPFAPMAAVLGVNGSGGGTPQMWDDPISTNPALNSVETWELWNRSADAHPIHLHLVKFEVVNREDILTGAVRGPEPWEAGWKDTVIAYPDEVTRVKALFDIPGLYVWHCHILSHEDNEMMVPYCVGDPANCTPPVQ